MERIQRFKTGDEVIVSNPALARYKQRGTILNVDASAPKPEDAGGPGPHHAIYKVEFRWNGFDEPQPPETATLYDHELYLATEK